MIRYYQRYQYGYDVILKDNGVVCKKYRNILCKILFCRKKYGNWYFISILCNFNVCIGREIL